MTLAAVVADEYPSWDERSVLVSRFLGALSWVGDVEVLRARGAEHATGTLGAADQRTFPARPSDPARRAAIERILLGPSSGPACSCIEQHLERLADDAPDSVVNELYEVSGGASPELFDHLEERDFEAVAFVDMQASSTLHGANRAGHLRRLLVPLATDRRRLRVSKVRDQLSVFSAVATATAYEASLLPTARTEVVRSVIRVHELALRNEPIEFESSPVIVIARDWSLEPPSSEFLLLVKRLNRDLRGDAVVRLIGPGWESLPDECRGVHADSRLDVWRWVSRAVALWYPTANAILAREAIEAMLYGTPVIAVAGGAAREHAELGNGGLWYRTYPELLAAMRLLVDDRRVRDELGQRGREYAETTYGDTDQYLKTIEQLVDRVTSARQP